MQSAAAPLVDDRFLLLETMGRGGMGSVYRAFDRLDERLVAVKVSLEGGPPGPSHPFSTEFEMWRRVRHPNIIRVYELGRVRRGPFPVGTPYLVLENFPGRPVHRALPPGRTKPTTLERLARRVLLALEHIHAAGLVHGDMKPGNVLVGTPWNALGRVKLTDFGLASRAGRAGEPGEVNGSFPFVSPESVLGLPVDGRADLYGLGLLLYLLAVGRMPVETGEPEDWIRWHLSGPPPELDGIRHKLPPRLARFIRRLVARDRHERPGSASEALRLLGHHELLARHRPPAGGRAGHAIVRLALDAARLGARRVLQLPQNRRDAAQMREELRLRSQVLGVDLYRLDGGGSQHGRDLLRLVLQLIFDRGPEARGLIHRHRVHRVLPVRALSGLPVSDTTHNWTPSGGSAAIAGCVSKLLLDASTRQPLVLMIGRRAWTDAVVRTTAQQLAAACSRDRYCSPARGGLLVVIEGVPSGTPAAPDAYEQPLVAPQLTQT